MFLSFASARTKNCNFTQAELVARVFVASEINQPVNQTASLSVKTAAEIESDLQTEYQAKLLHREILLPDHYLTSGWLREDEGISCWSFLTYPDIYKFEPEWT